MDRPSPSDSLAFKSEGVAIAVVAFALTRGTVADLLVTERRFATEVSAVLVLAVGFGVVLYGINLAVSARDRTYTRTVLGWFLGGAAAVGLVLGPLLIAASPGDATATAAAVGIVGGGAGLLVGIRGAEADRRQATVDRQIEQARLLNRILRHEVRNSVTILRGHSEILFEEREETADRSKTAITDAITRIERAVDETRFLTVGTVDGGSALGPVRLDEAIRRHAERTGRDESAVSVPSVTIRADRYVDRLLDELAALPDWADSGADPFAIDVGDRYVELSVTAPRAWLSAREREVLVEGIPEQERNDVDYGVPVVRLLVARYGGDIGVDDTGEAATLRVRLPRTDRTGTAGDTPGLASGTLWRTLGIGLAAGVAMGAFFQATTGTLPVIGALYGASVSSVGWVAHLFHSAVFATVFTVVRSEIPGRLLGESVGASVAAGVAYGLFLWFVLAGVVMSLWLNAVGVATPLPNLGQASFVGHLLWGGLVGALSTTLPPLPDRQTIRDRVLAAIGR
ncbi:histidine kinase [Halorubrum sp. Ea8]|uniref:histidine kinase n=1 Tax=Halorubrum sp. Ea8 TaxID=1383841 RepID=UPI000B99CF41|nr:histidine kinase [Halorubrum sp. Ea8]OYR47361.1 histidine kinase [Halorubrum sp. Ea8]